MKDQKNVQSPSESGVGFISRVGDIPHHSKKVAGVAEVIDWVLIWQPQPVLVSESCHGWHLRYQSVSLDQPVMRVTYVFSFGVEG